MSRTFDQYYFDYQQSYEDLIEERETYREEMEADRLNKKTKDNDGLKQIERAAQLPVASSRM
jgi:hypothetical protein